MHNRPLARYCVTNWTWLQVALYQSILVSVFTYQNTSVKIFIIRANFYLIESEDAAICRYMAETLTRLICAGMREEFLFRPDFQRSSIILQKQFHRWVMFRRRNKRPALIPWMVISVSHSPSTVTGVRNVFQLTSVTASTKSASGGDAERKWWCVWHSFKLLYFLFFYFHSLLYPKVLSVFLINCLISWWEWHELFFDESIISRILRSTLIQSTNEGFRHTKRQR